MRDKLEKCLSEIEDMFLDYEDEIEKLELALKQLKTNYEEREERVCL